MYLVKVKGPWVDILHNLAYSQYLDNKNLSDNSCITIKSFQIKPEWFETKFQNHVLIDGAFQIEAQFSIAKPESLI